MLDKVLRLLVSERDITGYLQLLRSMFKAIMTTGMRGACAWLGMLP